MRARWFVGAAVMIASGAVGLACGGDDSSSGDDGGVTGDGSGAFDAGPPLHFCPEVDAGLPDVWYPKTIDQACADGLDPCPLPPSECTFGSWHAVYTHGYCSQGKCVFTYRTAQCGGPNASCVNGACQCTLPDN